MVQSLPFPPLSTNAVVPVIPPAPVIVPVPVEVKVSAVPESAAPTIIPLFVPVLIKDNVPVAVIGFVILMAVAALALSVRL
jgi:hypothetical protein